MFYCFRRTVEGVWTKFATKRSIELFYIRTSRSVGLEFADIGYVLVSGQTAIAGKGDELLKNPDVGRLFLGG